MSLTLYNTLTRQQDIFKPIEEGKVGLYVCGPTVYDRAHLGNARPVIVFDVLYRLLSLEYEVTYVRNITDIDDKIIRASQERGQPIDTITQETTRLFHEDMAALGNLSPTHEPRATHHVTDMIALIEVLLSRDHAYEADGHVLFRVASYPDYGQLSRSQQDEILAGARVEVAPYKKDPADFVLWKPSTDEEPGWESPWGRGRPGWHIECSAMSKTFLGQTFDLHGGGRDLVFPHHENERAQSCAAHQAPFAHYWLHNGILTVNGTKMSKSLGNFVTVEDLLQKSKGEVIRCAVLMTHYRHSLDWTDQTLPQAKSSLDRLYGALDGYEENSSESSLFDLKDQGGLDSEFLSHLRQDMNTPAAFTRLHAMASSIHKETDAEKRCQRQKALKKSASVLGLLQQPATEWFQGGRPEDDLLSHDQIEKMIQDRLSARQQKDFAEADRIREVLSQQGVSLEDTPEGTKWKR